MGIFVFTLLASIICLVIGLAKPSAFSKLLGSSVSRKKISLIFGAGTLVSFVLIGATADPNAKPAKMEDVQKVVEQPVEKPTEVAKVPEPEAPKPVAPELKQETTIDKLWKALDASIRSRDGYDLSFDEETKTAKLTYTIDKAWDESAMVKTAYSILVKYGKEAFKVEGVDALTVNSKGNLTDSYGKSSIVDAVIITMPKTEFEQYNWDSLKYQSVYNQMLRSCTKHYIHPAILKNIEVSKLYLSDTISK